MEEVDVFFGLGGIGEEFVVEVFLGGFGELFVVCYLMCMIGDGVGARVCLLEC